MQKLLAESLVVTHIFPILHPFHYLCAPFWGISVKDLI